MDDLTFQVSEAIAIINQVHEQAFPFIIVEGEVASFKVNQDKFIFFDIKDSEGSLSCFMMVFQLKFPVEDGMRVKVVAQPKLTKWGKFSLTVKGVMPVGEGSLKKSQDMLKRKLQAEGLFDDSRKRPLPAMPGRVAVISSSQAAGYADFIKILQNRWGGLFISLYDVTVQGAHAPQDIIGALESVNAAEAPFDVVVIIRGGGSADDLSAFGHEDVVRAVAASRTPTLLGVGHEVDTSLCDLASDLRAATPSNAAELLVPDRAEVVARVSRWRQSIDSAQAQFLEDLVEGSQLLVSQVHDQVAKTAQIKYDYIKTLKRGLEQLNPERILQRGYGVIRQDGTALTSAAHATIGAMIDIELSDGNIGAKITNGR